MTDRRRLHTPVCERLGIRVPVLLAPMATVGTPELAAAVTRAGGLGSFGAYGMTVDQVRAAVARALDLAGPPLAVNVLLAPDEPRDADLEALRDLVAPFRRELGLEDPPPGPPDVPPSDPPLALVEAALEAGATAVSVGMGDPTEVAPAARAAGVPVLAGAATVEEAQRWVASGADVVIAQGAEAGGHRMTPGPGDRPPPLVGTFALVPQVVDAVDVPVVAAGGVMDGRGLAAALALGAAGVAMGTRFLLGDESPLPRFMKERLLGMSATETVVTDRVTGRPGRWVRGRLVDALAGGGGSLGWPAQRFALGDVRAAAARGDDPDVFPMLAGQGAPLARRTRPAAEIVEEVVAEAERVLSGAARPS